MLQPVFDRSPPDGLAGSPRDGAADEGGRRPPNEMAGGCSLPGGRGDSRGAGQPEHPYPSCAVPDFSTRGSPTADTDVGVSRYAEAWQLAEHDRDRVLHPGSPMSGSASAG